MQPEIIVALITSVSTGILALWGIWRQLKKDKTDLDLAKDSLGVSAVTAISDTALSLITPLRDKIKALEGELKVLEDKLDELERLLAQKDVIIAKLKLEIAEMQVRFSTLEEEHLILQRAGK